MSTIHFHGASVTAQAAPAGEVRYSRTAFGASHFNQAAYHFLPDVFGHAPFVCLIRVNDHQREFVRSREVRRPDVAMQRSIMPVWLTMPRLDDLEARRQSLVDAQNNKPRIRSWKADVGCKRFI